MALILIPEGHFKQNIERTDLIHDGMRIQEQLNLWKAEFKEKMPDWLREIEAKKQLMALEFQYNMQLKGVETEGLKQREKEKEDRKDERTKIQATQQSEMIEQRNSGKAPKNFESAGNDILGGGFNLGSFDPS